MPVPIASTGVHRAATTLVFAAALVWPMAAPGAAAPAATGSIGPFQDAQGGVQGWSQAAEPGAETAASRDLGAAVGFAPLSVTRNGISYAEGDPSAGSIERLSGALDGAPAPRGGDRLAILGSLGGPTPLPAHRRLRSLPEPTTWLLMLTGFAMIGGALRGLFMASRRLDRLRAEGDG